MNLAGSVAHFSKGGGAARFLEGGLFAPISEGSLATCFLGVVWPLTFQRDI